MARHNSARGDHFPIRAPHHIHSLRDLDVGLSSTEGSPLHGQDPLPVHCTSHGFLSNTQTLQRPDPSRQPCQPGATNRSNGTMPPAPLATKNDRRVAELESTPEEPSSPLTASKQCSTPPPPASTPGRGLGSSSTTSTRGRGQRPAVSSKPCAAMLARPGAQDDAATTA